jgi:tetratricopeptide (TPR) repeat protein
MSLTLDEAIQIAWKHHQAERLVEAELIYRQILAHQPNHPEALYRLGIIAGQRDHTDDAIELFQLAIKAKPDWPNAYSCLGKACVEAARYDEAIVAHRHAVALAPNDKGVLEGLGSALLAKGDIAEAIEHFHRMLALFPESTAALNGLAAGFRLTGRFEEALGLLRKSLAINPEQPMAYAHLATSGRQVADAQEFERLANLTKQPGLNIELHIAAEFGLAKLLDDADRFDEAFGHYAQANLLTKNWRAERGDIFDWKELLGRVDQLIKISTPQFFADRQGWGHKSDLPVFIVGMPRSGTTLVEQIAASHPDVFGAGELKDISHIANSAGEDGLTALLKWSADSAMRAAVGQLQRLQALTEGVSRVTDKMPDNVVYLGLIALLFPNARVIICRRDPRDNCLSCFFQNFSERNVWSCDLADCGRRYLAIDRLTNHWLRVLPLKMLEIQYEEMVADQEGQSRRLIDFLGLPWDPKCLDFHKTERTVMTASVWQVRQPIYNSSSGRWRHYERHLSPLLDVLANRSADVTE